MHRTGGLLLLFFASSALAETAPADLAQFERLQARLAEVADQVRPSVVAIRAIRKLEPGEEEDPEVDAPEAEDGKNPERLYPSLGSGVILSGSGLILTNEHVVHNADPSRIECTLADARTYSVQGLTSDPRSDLAVVRIEARDLRPARLGDLGTVRQGHFAIVMGNPFGSATENSGRSAMSFGVISALGQDLTSKLDLSRQRYYGNLIQTDARINPGNSGGPLLNLRAEVIGITTAISTRSGASEGVGYAIAIDQRTRSIIAQLMSGEEVEYGFIGVRLEMPTEAERKRAGCPSSGGAVIRDVEPGTPAAASQLAAGDIVVAFDKRPVENVDEFVRLAGAAHVGQDVEITVYRDAERLNFKVTPARKQVLHGVRIERPVTWRGMTVAEPSEEVCKAHNLPKSTEGLVIVQLEPDSPAARAALKPGQVIRRLGSDPVKGLRQFRELTAKTSGEVKLATADEVEHILKAE